MMLSDIPDDMFMLVDRIDVRCLYADKDYYYAYASSCKTASEWLATRSITPSTQLAGSSCPELELTVPPKGNKCSILVCDQGRDVLLLEINRIWCKAGIVLKSREDIGLYLFPYNFDPNNRNKEITMTVSY